MRILFDARLARRGLGIATFVTELAKALIATGATELVWLGDPRLAPPGTARALALDRRPYPLLDGPAGRALARRVGADVIHFTGNTGWGRGGKIASVLTLHDLIFLDSRAGSRSIRQRAGHRYERLLVPRAAHAADVLAVPSQTVAQLVSERIAPREPPRVIYEGVSPPALAHADPQQTPYLIAFAGRDPRKNTSAVVDGWRLLEADRLNLKLLAAGGMPPGLEASLAPELAAGRVEIHRYVPRGRLWALLGGAVALIYPSSDEGFGLPVLEAMAAGTPVLGGIAAATGEIGGDALVELDSADIPASIAACVRRLVADASERDAIRARGAERIRRFTWEATASGYLSAYEAARASHR